MSSPSPQPQQQPQAPPPQAPQYRSLRLPTSFAIIFGAFTLGFHVAIQGPTLMDLIDLLHINNDIMSYTLAFASLAYAFGGLSSGVLFNYVNRQVLIAVFYVIFGLANIVTPFISNYYVFSVLTVFKMMCAGGTDCGANVWMLELWPGKDAWLQALHFSFAVGCALGPLIVEPFLSHDDSHKDGDIEAKLHQGGALINDQNSESRIYIPYGVSGSLVLLSAFLVSYLYWLEESRKRELARFRAKQLAASGEHILLTALQHPAAIEAGLSLPETIPEEQVPLSVGTIDLLAPAKARPQLQQQYQLQRQRASSQSPSPSLKAAPTAVAPNHDPRGSCSPKLAAPKAAELQQVANQAANQAAEQPLLANNVATIELGPGAGPANQTQAQHSAQAAQKCAVKITSKATEQRDGRPPYYVMFAIALAALCLSFYCGIEITSMNYLATFAVNIDLQLNKSTAALMSSALTISFAVGRAFGIWIAAYVKPHKLFYLCSGVMATGNVFMLIFANTAETFLWCSICLFGIGCGPMFPAIVSFYDDKVSKVSNTVSGIFILGSMFNVALNSLIIGHYIIDNALILIVCNLIGSVVLLFLFAILHMLTKVKKQQRVRKYKLQQERQQQQLQQQDKLASPLTSSLTPPLAPAPTSEAPPTPGSPPAPPPPSSQPVQSGPAQPDVGAREAPPPSLPSPSGDPQ